MRINLMILSRDVIAVIRLNINLPAVLVCRILETSRLATVIVARRSFWQADHCVNRTPALLRNSPVKARQGPHRPSLQPKILFYIDPILFQPVPGSDTTSAQNPGRPGLISAGLFEGPYEHLW
jgi:hypothetical protein